MNNARGLPFDAAMSRMTINLSDDVNPERLAQSLVSVLPAVMVNPETPLNRSSTGVAVVTSADDWMPMATLSQENDAAVLATNRTRT